MLNSGEIVDLRFPVGILFLALGALLMLYGAASSERAPAASFNINLIWGAVMLAFGALMAGGAALSVRRQGRPPH